MPSYLENYEFIVCAFPLSERSHTHFKIEFSLPAKVLKILNEIDWFIKLEYEMISVSEFNQDKGSYY